MIALHALFKWVSSLVELPGLLTRCCYVVNDATCADDICYSPKDSFQFFATSLSLIPGDVSNVFLFTGFPTMCAV